MHWLRKLAVLALALSLAPSMVAACLFPLAQLTAAELECCRIMPADCGREPMPDAHSCCKATAETNTVVFAAVKSFTVAPPLESGGPAAVHSVSLETRLVAAHDIFASIHSPPESPPDSITVLRI
ncbi:MAG TPA: hypothetical protein VLE48_00855 [Terriglobales bacterium]|nr:hypothetical protein [Terriglobales bacterium]